MSIGQVIKVVREERGLTQSQFAHELFVTQQALSRWEKGTAEPSIDMIRLISTRFEVPMARLMEMPDNGFCQSCAMPFYRPEDHGTEPDGTRSGDYCNYCYDDGVFLQDYANSDELIDRHLVGLGHVKIVGRGNGHGVPASLHVLDRSAWSVAPLRQSPSARH